MNAAHFEQIRNRAGTQRGPRRDALTLFDECGVIVASHSAPLLNALARHDWRLAFNEFAGSWQEKTFVSVCGHAMLEKFLDPYKAMTAQSLLLQLDASQARLERRELLEMLDRGLATSIGEGKLLQSSQDLSPLPLAGIPGWWLWEPQDENFYADRRVFRPFPAGKQAGRIFDARSYQASP
jgi:hypothetical protein